MIRKITTEELCRMKDSEGLILQGCGGDPHEWVDGVNDMLTEAGVLLNGTRFKPENSTAFDRPGVTEGQLRSLCQEALVALGLTEEEFLAQSDEFTYRENIQITMMEGMT